MQLASRILILLINTCERLEVVFDEGRSEFLSEFSKGKGIASLFMSH